MSNAALPTASEETPAARLVSVDMDEWSPAGGAVHIDFAPERTVLVGKNASGKSIVLEGIAGGAASSTDAARISHGDPHRMCFTLRLSDELVSYSYGWVLKEDSDGEYYVGWEERCWRTKADEEIWRVSDNVAHISDSAQIPMPPGTGLLSLRGTPSFPFPPEVEGVRKLLGGVRFVGAGVPRARQARRSAKFPRKRLEKLPQPRARSTEHVDEMAFRLMAWFEDRRELFDHFVALARRLGVARRVDVIIESVDASAPYKDIVDSWTMLSFDGVDFGLLSDGTLRLAEILVGFVDPKISVLVVEEPETGLHPGLLHRLLAEVDSHALDRQVILSTHSPLVVDWAKPSDIRLIERTDGKTTVRSLGAEEKESLKRYLNDDFGLSDYIYSSEETQ